MDSQYASQSFPMYPTHHIEHITLEKTKDESGAAKLTLQVEWQGALYYLFRVGSHTVVYRELNGQPQVPSIQEVTELRKAVIDRHNTLPKAEKDFESQLEMIDQAHANLASNEVWLSRFTATDHEAILKETALWGRYEKTIIHVLNRWVPDGKLSILEAGSGSGRLAIALAKKNPDARVVGVDLLDDAVDLASTGAKLQRVHNVEFIRGDALNLPNLFPHEKFDVVFSVGVYEHFPEHDTEQFIAAQRGLVKPGGTLIVSVPNARSPVYKFWKRIAGDNLVYRFGLERDVHAKEVIDILRRVGVEQVAVKGSDPLYGLRKMYRVDEQGAAIPVWWAAPVRTVSNWVAPLVDWLDRLSGERISSTYGFDFIIKGVVPAMPSAPVINVDQLNQDRQAKHAKASGLSFEAVSWIKAFYDLKSNLKKYQSLPDGKKLNVRKSFMAYLKHCQTHHKRNKLTELIRTIEKADQNGSDTRRPIQEGLLLDVLCILLEDPLMPSEIIAEKSGLNADKDLLIQIYTRFRENAFYSDLLSHHSNAPRAVSMFKEASRIDDVVGVIEGTKPYVARFEIWLGLGCQYICDHCFSTELQDNGEVYLVPHPKPRSDARPISIEDLKKVIDEGINPDKGFRVPYFLFSGGKEPFSPGTNKKVTEGVKYIKERALHYGIRKPNVVIYTNGIGLEDWVREVCVENVDSIRISMDGASRRAWEDAIHTISEKSRGRVTFENVVRNILELVELRDPSPSPLKIRIANLLLRGNFQEWKKMVKLAVLLGVDTLEFKRYIGWPEEIDRHEPPEEDLIEVVEALRELVESSNAPKALYRAIKSEPLEANIVDMITQRKGKTELQLLKENVEKLNVLIEDTFKSETDEDGGKHFLPFFHQTYGQDLVQLETPDRPTIAEKTAEKTWLNGFPSRCLAADLWMILGPHGEILVCTPMLHARIMRDLVLGENHPEYIKGIVGDYEEDPLTHIFNNSRESVKQIDTNVCFYRCDHNGINFNWIFRKILADTEWGIDVEQQPFDPYQDRYFQLMGRDK